MKRRGPAGNRGAISFKRRREGARSTRRLRGTARSRTILRWKDELIRAATILADAGDRSDEDLAALLVAEGFAEPVAYRLVAFLPSAFARPCWSATTVAFRFRRLNPLSGTR